MPTMRNLMPLSLVAALVSAEQMVYINWSAQNAPRDGLTDVSFPMAMPNAPHVSAYYFEQAVGINNADNHDGSPIIYTGLQPREDQNGKSVVHAVFSTFLGDTSTSDSNCYAGADGASEGVSCALDFYGSYDTTYVLNIAKTTATTYVGTITDTKTNTKRHVGSFELPADVGGMNDHYGGFIEYYYSDLGDCSKYPNTAVTWGVPTSANSGVKITLSKPYANSDCAGKIPWTYSKASNGGYTAVVNP